MIEMTKAQSAETGAESAVQALAALAQHSRLAVFRLLVQAGPSGLAAGTIAQRIDIAPSALTFHIKALVAASLVTSSKSGRFVYYQANYAAMNSLLAYLTENCCAESVNCKNETG